MFSKTLHFPSPRHASALYAGREENLVHAERALGVKFATREDWVKIDGPADRVAQAEALFGFLDRARTQGMTIRTPDFHRISDAFARGEGANLQKLLEEPLVIATNRKTIVPKTLGQKLYLQSMLAHPVVFGIGPAGTGKTYLAMAAAVNALLKNQVERIILTRPAVEAGEALGFLPGDLREKILPLPPSALRRAARHARRRGCRPPHRERRHRNRPARLHARPHALARLHRPRRGAKTPRPSK